VLPACDARFQPMGLIVAEVGWFLSQNSRPPGLRVRGLSRFWLQRGAQCLAWDRMSHIGQNQSFAGGPQFDLTRASELTSKMNVELETWLLDVGDLVIQKKADGGAGTLSEPERAIYWMWLIDYAVRNSGSFGPLEDMDSTALTDLATFASDARLLGLASWLSLSSDEEAFCATYHDRFDEGCAELKAFYERSGSPTGS